jgi:hypothetical protein
MAKHVIKVESVHEEQIGATSAEVIENTQVDVVGWKTRMLMHLMKLRTLMQLSIRVRLLILPLMLKMVQNRMMMKCSLSSLVRMAWHALEIHLVLTSQQGDFYSKSVNFVLPCLDNY